MSESLDFTDVYRFLGNAEEKSFALLEIIDSAVAREDTKTLRLVTNAHIPKYLEEITGGTVEHIYNYIQDEGEQ